MSAPPALVLLASPDDYLLELERTELERAWRDACPDGEVLELDPAPGPGRLLQELASPSLFAPRRLLVVRDASPYLAGKAKDAEPLAQGLRAFRAPDVGLVLVAVTAREPSGPLADACRERGAVRWLPLPATPKPWEEVRVSPAQRQALEGVLRRVAPAVLEHREVVDALLEAYGFKPRELAQAAARLLLAGDLSPDGVRKDAGPGELSLGAVEDLLLRRDAAAMAHFLARLGAGAALVDWRGDAISPGGVGPVLCATIGNLLRRALALRGHARRAGLERELDPRRCAGRGWYGGTFKNALLPRLSGDIEASAGSPVAGQTPWQLHRVFRLAAAYTDAELAAALAALAASGADRCPTAHALPILTHLLLATIRRPARA